MTQTRNSDDQRKGEWIGRWLRIILLIDAILLPILVTLWAFFELRG